jgi:hypothetical protein
MPETFNPQPQEFSVLIENKRIGTAQTAQYNINRGSERLNIAEGYGGHGKGTEEISVTINTIIYASGVPYDPHKLLMDAINSGKYITLTNELSGEIYAQTGVLTQHQASYDAVKRTTTGQWTFEGGNRVKV